MSTCKNFPKCNSKGPEISTEFSMSYQTSDFIENLCSVITSGAHLNVRVKRVRNTISLEVGVHLLYRNLQLEPFQSQRPIHNLDEFKHFQTFTVTLLLSSI